MCGIYCHLGRESTLNNIVNINHRGPDNFSSCTFNIKNKLLEFAHWRLSIIDLNPGSNQPMEYADGRYWIVYNGEIYNYIELRNELIQKKYKFNTGSDTEVILASYAEYGFNCLERLRGMFAFVIYDSLKGTLFAARDRFGIKPLYYFIDAAGITFASEIKQFTGLPDFNGKLNIQRAYDYLRYGFLDHTGETLFKGINQLRGGQYLLININSFDNDAKIVEWYTLDSYDLGNKEDEIVGRFKELFDETLKLHLRSDVLIGSCLSGGMDSSSIVCSINNLIESKGTFSQYVFTNCVRNLFDERKYVEVIAAERNFIPNYIYLDYDELNEKIEGYTYGQDEPFNSMSIIAQGNLFKYARKKNVVVMLDGQGSDELLGSYDIFLYLRIFQLLKRGRLTSANKVLISNNHLKLKTGLKQIFNIYLPEIARLAQRSFSYNYLDSLIRNENWKGIEGLETEIFSNVRSQYDLSQVMCKYSPIPMLLHWEDRSSMINSVEARVPFLDHKLAEFIISIPDNLKYKNGIRKYPLKRAMSGIVPKKILDRNDKIGFETEEIEFMKSNYTANIFSGSEFYNSLAGELVDIRSLNKRLNEFRIGSAAYDNIFWRVLSFHKWAQIFNLDL